MFNLEQAIAEWRGRMAAESVKSRNALDELESHLRDEVEQQVRNGAPEQQAFETAAQMIGQAGALKMEFAKLDRGSRFRIGKLWRLIRAATSTSFVGFPSPDGFTPVAQRTLDLARIEASGLCHDYVGTEHALLGLLAQEDGTTVRILKALGLESGTVRTAINRRVVIGPAHPGPAGLPCTPRLARALELAGREAKASGHTQAGAGHILLGLLLEGDGVASRVLKELGVDAGATRRELART